MLVRRYLTLALTLIVAPAAPSPLAGQSAGTGPTWPRPRLQAGADTNSALDYFTWATLMLRRDPALAAAGFYWAARLEPNHADALYGLHVARLIASDQIVGWFEEDRAVMRRPEIRAIDSLRHRAMWINPFLHERFSALVLECYAVQALTRETGGRYPRAEIEAGVQDWLNRNLEPGVRAWRAAINGNYQQALRVWGEMAARSPRPWGLRVIRARAFMQMGNSDSAAAELRSAIEALRTADTTRMWHTYDSKESLEFALGYVLERRGDVPGAREAYQRALLENLGFWPAHNRLAMLALAQRDTATAVRELEAALAVNEADYTARLTLGWVLGVRGRIADAIAHLERAAEVEPFAARSWFLLGASHDAAGHRAEAVAAYERFVDRASRNDPGRAPVDQRLATLRGR